MKMKKSIDSNLIKKKAKGLIRPVSKTSISVASGIVISPVLGPILTEIIFNLIPNQRQERVFAYVEKLQTRFPEKKWEEFIKLPEKFALIEEGMFAVGLTPQKNRLERITNVIANGLSEKELDADYHSTLIRLTRELSDAEFMVLEFYGLKHNKIGSERSFEKKHPEIWPEAPGGLFSKDKIDPQEREQYKFKMEKLQTYETHLSSLSLLEQHYRHSVYEEGDLTLSGKEFNNIRDVVRELTEYPDYKITQLGLDVLAAIKQPEATA